ncbi:hypothetical protein ACHAWO_004593 [Cyclotella atomus]|uniref:Methyltransferase type 11 domain-containing protein n=1 Tax=Cyclotella atomus TaxID=382360 RepID=A0ABD3PP05_9STRA
MAIVSRYGVLLLVCGLSAGTAFAPAKLQSTSSVSTEQSSTALNAFPPLIIGPMIKRMREEKERSKMPMARADEAKNEAPGLRVGEGAWKWPPVWPYDRNFFKRRSELDAAKNAASPLSMMSGQVPAPDANGQVVDKNVFDSLGYWEKVKDVKTELDERVAEKIKNHYSFYLRDGMSVLELGAAEESYLPDGLKLNRHVGIGAVKSQMEQNPSITESFVVDLNDVVEDIGIKSVDFSNLGEDTFDAIIMANTIDFINNPREVFKSCWRALKPGGIMMVPFLAKDAYVDKFDEAFTKQWRDMTDDQHMWVAGSFFVFSAGDGWEGLKGFDISPEDAKKPDENVLSKLTKGNDNSPPGAYVVQARKKFQDDEVDEDDLEGYINSKLWMLPTLETRDKKLIVPRLARAYELLDTEDEKHRMLSHTESLPRIYESLIKMDQFAFTFSMQAQLAADLVGDPDFTGSDIQINNMKMGLGLRKPSADFWAPVGKLTAAMTPEEKINLLAYIVPRFDSGDPAQEEALKAFVSGLEPTFALIRSKCPDMKERDVQLLGSELLASEVLRVGRSSREEFALWLDALDEDELKSLLLKRKSVQTDAKLELNNYRKEVAAEKNRVEERRKKIQEQVMDARENRSIMFNPKTEKFEAMPKKGGIELPGGIKLPF